MLLARLAGNRLDQLLDRRRRVETGAGATRGGGTGAHAPVRGPQGVAKPFHRAPVTVAPRGDAGMEVSHLPRPLERELGLRKERNSGW